MSICRNCHRENKADVGCYAGPFFFCSFLCRDTSEDLQRYSQMKAAEKRLVQFTGEQFDVKPFSSQSAEPTCGIPNCAICSGAMRSRAGKGDDT